MLFNKAKLGFANTITIEDDHLWEAVVLLLVFEQASLHEFLHNIDDLLSLLFLDMQSGIVPRELVIDCNTEPNNTFSILPYVVKHISPYNHCVLWYPNWLFNLPRYMPKFCQRLNQDVGQDRFLVPVPSIIDRVLKNYLGSDTNLLEACLLDLFV